MVCAKTSQIAGIINVQDLILTFPAVTFNAKGLSEIKRYLRRLN